MPWHWVAVPGKVTESEQSVGRWTCVAVVQARDHMRELEYNF